MEMRNRRQVKVAIGGFTTSIIVHANKREGKESFSLKSHTWWQRLHEQPAYIRKLTQSYRTDWGHAVNSSQMEQWTIFLFFGLVSAWNLWFNAGQKMVKNMKNSCPLLIENLFLSLKGCTILETRDKCCVRNYFTSRFVAYVMTNVELLSQQPPAGLRPCMLCSSPVIMFNFNDVN